MHKFDIGKTMLAPRGLFNGNHNHHHRGWNHTCPVPNESGPPIVPLVSNFTFQHIALIAAGAMMGVACILSFGLIMAHALHFSAPLEQKQIIRIILTIPVFAITAFLSILAESQADYLTPISDVYESWALAAFFLMLSSYISPVSEEREKILQEREKLGMYNRVWFFVFQQPVVMTILVAVQEITQAAGVYCATSNKIQFGHVWVSSLSALTTTLAITAVLRFHGATKSLTAHQKPMLKLVSFKGIVFLSWIQTTLFSFLKSSGHLHANNHLSFDDLSVAIPSLIVCGEMVFFSVLFQFAYRVKPYTVSYIAANAGGNGSRVESRYFGGFLGIKALLAAFNIFDLIKGILAAPAKLMRGRAMLDVARGPKTEPSSKSEGEESVGCAAPPEYVQRLQ